MTSVTPHIDLDELTRRVDGPVFGPGSDAFTREVASFNLAIVHKPDVVAGVTTVGDIQESVDFARENGLHLSVIGGGHSTEAIFTGLAINTSRLSTVSIDVDARTATFGAGVRWGAVIAAAAEHGLHPITGSSPIVGAVGYLLGGGLGPLARSHGVSSDYLEAATIVTGDGRLLHVDASTHPDLLWALRGGKKGFGIVADMTVRLVPLETIYAGSLTFAGQHIEPVLRGWLRWTSNADPNVSTSVASIRFPDTPALPDHLRGRHILQLRFAWPGDPATGESLASPLRSLAPALDDRIGQLHVRDLASIHNDPTQPGAVWMRGMLLRDVDDAFADALIEEVGPDQPSPFNLVEIRHMGGAVRQDVSEGSAFNGRSATFVMGVGALEPSTFLSAAPSAASRLRAAIDRWTMPDNTINFLGTHYSAEDVTRSWSPETHARLEGVRRRVDPDGVFRHDKHGI